MRTDRYPVRLGMCASKSVQCKLRAEHTGGVDGVASGFPRSPTLLKGAIVAYESQFLGPVPNVIVLQYNPAELTRALSHRAGPPNTGEQGEARADVQRVQGPPVETIRLTITLDAADQLEAPGTHPVTVARGLHPALAALELLMYPKASQILLNRTLAKAGSPQVQYDTIPVALFIWGPARVVPVRLNSFSITEQAFDQVLNPIRAEVELDMRVLTYMEFEEESIGFAAYLATQAQKEAMARANLLQSAEHLGLLPF